MRLFQKSKIRSIKFFSGIILICTTLSLADTWTTSAVGRIYSPATSGFSPVVGIGVPLPPQYYESNLILGSNGFFEGGQIQLNNPSSTGPAALIDMYPNGTDGYLRFLGGTNAGSSVWLASLNLVTGDFGTIGSVSAKSIKINNWTIDAPDYVFEPGYKLTSLHETELFVSKNKHLPEIPSAAQMKNNGIDLAEMNMKLLQKVEELTLHAIEQNKRIEKLETQGRRASGKNRDAK